MTQTLTERRFREGSGERYMPSGKVRCQALAKSKIRRWREINNDQETPTEDLWPECQCEWYAVDGMFACRFHGGLTPGMHKPKSILDVIPVDLGEKFKTLLENPNYISRQEDIILLKARQWELLESLEGNTGNEEAWASVADALTSLRQGKEVEAVSLLEEALAQNLNTREVWDEIYKSEGVLKDLTKVEVSTAKELRLMATTEQVTALLTNIYNLLDRAAEKYFDDKRIQAEFMAYIVTGLSRFANLSPVSANFLPEP